MENEFQETINYLLLKVNKAVYNDYKNLPQEIKQKLITFTSNNIEYYYSKNTNVIDKSNKNKLYINYDNFMENNQFDISKIEKNKKLIIETYIKKIVLNNNSNIKLNPYSTNKEEIENFIQRHDFEIKNFLKEQQNKEEIKEKDDKEVIAQNYNIAPNNINKLIINQHIYYTFIKDGNPKMIETLNENELKNDIKTNQSKEEIQNNLEKTKIQISIIPIKEILQHQQELNSLSKEQMNKIKILLSQQEKLKIKYINLSNGIAIKENGEYVYADKNSKGEYEVKDAKKESQNNIIVNEENENYYTSNYQKENENDYTYNYQKENEENQQEPNNINKKDKQKILTLKINNTGASNILILSLITSFVGGIILTILFSIIK